jgi:hypothetical protein
MWGIYWMALRDGRKVKVSDELAFCWPFEFAFRWHKTKILHNAGVTREQSEKYFYKGIYTARMPYFDDLSFVTKDHCSWYYVKAMEAYFNEKKKIDLQDVGFLIIVRIDSPCRLLNIRAIVNFLHVNFSTHIYILESDAEQKLHEKWPAGVDYTFLEDKQLLFNRGRLNNYLLRKCRQPIAAIYDADIITPAAQMLAACALIRSGHADISSPYDGTVYAVDSFFKGIFLETLQEQILSHNSAKFPITTRRAVGGVVFVKREQYLMLGGENRKIYSWGPDDQERVKRMQLLGYTFRRIPGPIYHLPHARGVNSSYSSLAHWRNHMGEYFKICAMEKSHLQAYIQDNLVFH